MSEVDTSEFALDAHLLHAPFLFYACKVRMRLFRWYGRVPCFGANPFAFMFLFQILVHSMDFFRAMGNDVYSVVLCARMYCPQRWLG